jgi:hypothetical protein
MSRNPDERIRSVVRALHEMLAVDAIERSMKQYVVSVKE